MDTAELERIRKDFPALAQQRNGRAPVYFDNACTTIVPEPVIRSIRDYYEGYPGCGGGRSRHWFAAEVASRIEGDPERGVTGSREKMRDFINARSAREIIFTLNTTHAINLVALGTRFKPGDIVLLTDREHNSNLLPWLRLEKQGIIEVATIPASHYETFDLGALKEKLAGKRVRLVSLAYTSNLTGATVPAEEIIALAHQYGARVLLDAAQTVPHRDIDIRELDVDFLAFSLHKMCGPRGVGVLYGKEELLGTNYHEADEPDLVLLPVVLGGGTVGDSLDDDYFLLDPPDRFEAGLQHYPGLIAAGTAADYIREIGLDAINEHLGHLNRFLSVRLMERYADTGWFRIIGPVAPEERAGILTFEIKRPNAVGIAEELDERSNIMVRDGVYCVHSYFNRIYGQGWTRPHLPSEQRMTYRVSMYFYNTIEECDLFLETLHAIFTERSYI